ncbi:hypothetical protein I7I53_08273 [Histoplasma capsulatum var. duboisii H88]|uniref:Uncharacterized protein n=1 Tax=Ajellomyces capsulatus (strain H88) TaxID=544711 RepID=A0A8A1LIW5_AJEC8|nr:hypothetical protein I7I53_08273 [Histoplasma capsulatum var. duboisii H88]
MDPTAIPLTTVFTPPSSCSSSWTYEGSYYNSVTGGLLIQNVFASHDFNCFPPSFEGSGRGQNQQVYSPGFCPVGYTSPAATTVNGVTTAVCCPSDYTYYTTLTTINFYSSTTIFAGCISEFPEGGTTTVLARTGQERLVNSVVTGPVSMWGQPLVVQFKSADLSLFTDALTTSSPSTTGTTGQTSSPTDTRSRSATPSQAANNNQPSSTSSPDSFRPSGDNASTGLSAGAKAGIGVGVAGLALLLAALVFFIRRSRRRRNAHMPPLNAVQELDAGTSHAGTSHAGTSHAGFWAPKLYRRSSVHEMPTS